jgi:mono/diheme cytochrome c family protein
MTEGLSVDTAEGRPKRRARRWLGLVAYALTAMLGVLSVVAAITWFAPAPTYTPKTIELGATPTPERLARGREIASVLCTRCHLDPETGKLSGRPMAKMPLGETWSSNITQDPAHGIGAWTDGQIAYALRTGVTPSGHFAAPGMPKLTLLSDEDVLAVVAFLRSDDPLVAPSDAIQPSPKLTFVGKAVLRFAMKPAAYPSSPMPGPDDRDPTDQGRYLVQAVALCWRCHSASYETHDDAHPERSKGYLAGGTEFPDVTGRTILSPNITADADTGLGRWSEEQFVRALRQGLRPDGVALSPAMPMFTELSEDEAHAIWSYLRSLPAVKHAVARSLLRPEPGASSGRQAYVKYGCIGCHGETGIHIGDLRRVNTDLPADPDLLAWIEHPSAKRPGTKMPDFAGVIAPADYAPLMAYVRSLGFPVGAPVPERVPQDNRNPN